MLMKNGQSFNDTQLEGKIVVYDQGWFGYSHGYEFRFSGAKEASKHGAVGCLIRSVTDFSIYAPHTGSQVCLCFQRSGPT